MPYCGVHYLWSAFVCFLVRSHPPPPPPTFEGSKRRGVLITCLAPDAAQPLAVVVQPGTLQPPFRREIGGSVAVNFMGNSSFFRLGPKRPP